MWKKPPYTIYYSKQAADFLDKKEKSQRHEFDRIMGDIYKLAFTQEQPPRALLLTSGIDAGWWRVPVARKYRLFYNFYHDKGLLIVRKVIGRDKAYPKRQ
jgi:mRNA-degrading endonuclease RelE of RelBE toxin-antitoxin system